MAKRILPIAVVALALGGLLLWSQQQSPIEKVSGVIEADEIRLGSRVGGRVKEVKVEEGAAVERGQPLVVLEEFDLRERLAEAQATRDERRQELNKLNAGLQKDEIAQAKARYERFVAVVNRTQRKALPEEFDVARARVRLANAEFEQSQQHERRLLEVAEKQPQAVSQDQLDQAAQDTKVARAKKEVAEAELQILDIGTREEERQEAIAQRDEALAAWELAKTFYREEDKAKAQAALDAAAAAVAVMETQLGELTIRSSVDGIVEAMELQPGDLVAPSAPMISMLDTGSLWVRAYVPQGRLDIQRGQKLKVTVDAYPNRTFEGEVTFVSREAEFTPSNVQTYDERAKQMFRIKVQLIPPDDPNVQLRPGMTADVWLK